MTCTAAIAMFHDFAFNTFSAAPRLKAIAVLHPRKLGVYTVAGIGGKGGEPSYYELFKAYEHVFGVEGGGHFTSYNMTHGGFGGVPRDLICVQSMDGRLQVRDAHDVLNSSGVQYLLNSCCASC